MGRKSKIKTEKKANRKANSIVLVLLSAFMFFIWATENKGLNFDNLIEIEGELVSYRERVPGNRGTGYEVKVLFVKLNNYKAEFHIPLNYNEFKKMLQGSSTNTIKIFIEPKYEKALLKLGSDVEIIGLDLNDETIIRPVEKLKARNSMMKYGIPIIGLVLLIFGLNEISYLRKK